MTAAWCLYSTVWPVHILLFSLSSSLFLADPTDTFATFPFVVESTFPHSSLRSRSYFFSNTSTTLNVANRHNAPETSNEASLGGRPSRHERKALSTSPVKGFVAQEKSSRISLSFGRLRRVSISSCHLPRPLQDRDVSSVNPDKSSGICWSHRPSNIKRRVWIFVCSVER